MLQLATTVAEIPTFAVVAAKAGAARKARLRIRIPKRTFFIDISCASLEAWLFESRRGVQGGAIPRRSAPIVRPVSWVSSRKGATDVPRRKSQRNQGVCRHKSFIP